MRLSPTEAIRAQQVWLRPFGYFLPGDQAYMGFSEPEIRDQFLNSITDGALVVVWGKQSDSDPAWKGFFRGILQVERRAATTSDLSSSTGEHYRTRRESSFFHAVPVVRAWEADPTRKAMMKGMAPSI